MRSILNRTLFLLILSLGAAGAARAQEKPVVYWPYFNLPPQFIVDRGGPAGMGIDVARALQRELPEYEHVFIAASPQRIDEELRSGRARLVVSGMLKTPEREAYILYSDVPCRMTFSMMVVLRREDGRRLVPPGVVSLAGLAADRGLSYGYVPGLVYGSFAPFVAPLTADADHPHAYAAHDVAQLLDMLAEKRIDWFVHDTPGIWYAAGQRGMRERIAMVQAEECPPCAILGYFACSRTAEGAGLMSRINRAMTRLVASGELYRTLRHWAPGGLDDAFDQTYADCILSEAHLAACGEACPPDSAETR